METKIELLTSQHAREVQKLSEQLGYPLSLHATESNVKEIISNHDHVAYVAVMDQKVVGWIHAFRSIFLESKPFIEIAGLVVDENHRAQGIGKNLIERIKQWCVQKQVACLRVRPQLKRKEAHQFYTNNGFIEIKEQKVFQMEL